jgi:hypothetical protein
MIKMIKSLVLGLLAAFLLIGAPQAMALSVDLSLVVEVNSASGEVSVEEDVCMAAINELINVQGFVFQSSRPVGKTGGPDLTAYLFTSFTDVATLYCITDINIGDGLGGPCGPGGPGGPGGC